MQAPALERYEGCAGRRSGRGREPAASAAVGAQRTEGDAQRYSSNCARYLRYSAGRCGRRIVVVPRSVQGGQGAGSTNRALAPLPGSATRTPPHTTSAFQRPTHLFGHGAVLGSDVSELEWADFGGGKTESAAAPHQTAIRGRLRASQTPLDHRVPRGDPSRIVKDHG